jgi:hypothetical protein
MRFFVLFYGANGLFLDLCDFFHVLTFGNRGFTNPRRSKLSWEIKLKIEGGSS